MFVGVLRLVLHLPGSRSLKDKRQIVRSLKDRVRSRLHLSVAEVGDPDRLQVATVAVVAVSNEAEGCYQQLGNARNLASQLPEALLSDVREDVVSYGADGARLSDSEPFAFSRRGPNHDD